MVNLCIIEKKRIFNPKPRVATGRYAISYKSRIINRKIVQMQNVEFKNAETISWILLAISIASQSSPTTFEGIMQIADGINHSVPTQKEMQTSISWLIANDLILKEGKKYSLSENGKILNNNAEKQNRVLMKMWKHLESELKQKYNDIA